MDDPLNFALLPCEALPLFETDSQPLDILTRQRSFDTQTIKRFEPKRWLYLNHANQITQAALTGQGVALARSPLVADSLASEDLVEPFPKLRLDSPLVCWLIVGPKQR